MTVTLDSTTLTLTLDANGKRMPVRLWQGTTASGIPVYALIPRIVVGDGHPERPEQQAWQERFAASWALGHAEPTASLRDGWEGLVPVLWLEESPKIAALYDIARDICHENGISWTDPRTGITYPPADWTNVKPTDDSH